MYFGPTLNYKGSGESGGGLILDLDQPDQILGWTIVVKTMTKTAEAWKSAGMMTTEGGTIDKAVGMGLAILKSRIGLLS